MDGLLVFGNFLRAFMAFLDFKDFLGDMDDLTLHKRIDSNSRVSGGSEVIVTTMFMILLF